LVKKTNVTMTLQDEPSANNWGDLWINAGTVSTPVTAQQLMQDLLTYYQQNYPDLKACANPYQLTIDGVTGPAATYCYTYTPQSGSAFPSMSILWAAANSAGTTIYEFELDAPQSLTQLPTDTGTLLQTLHWLGVAAAG